MSEGWAPGAKWRYGINVAAWLIKYRGFLGTIRCPQCGGDGLLRVPNHHPWKVTNPVTPFRKGPCHACQGSGRFVYYLNVP